MTRGVQTHVGKHDRDLVGAYKKAQRMLKKASRPDLYKAISPDLDETSDDAALKKAYKKAALKWHPDRFAAKGEEEQKNAAAFRSSPGNTQYCAAVNGGC